MALQQRRPSLLNRYFAFLQRRSISDRILFHATLLAVFASIMYAGLTINANYLTTVPSSGGTLVEGIVGTPRFVNPVLAISRADHDMVALIYSGLLKIDENGNLVNDVAESIDISEDGRTYNIKLKEGVRFHDGSELTARDISYTIALIQNPDLKSPLRGNWEGVLVEELGEYELNIVLEEAYTPFMENLTVGILPRSIWDELPTEQLPFSQHNTEPVGSGPYQIEEVMRSTSGLINAYKLHSFGSSEQQPNITNLHFQFYQNEDELLTALKNKEIAGTPSLSTSATRSLESDAYTIIESALPRTFAIYFNQNKSSMLRDVSVRKALSAAIDRDELIETVLDGYGIPIQTPVPEIFLPVEFASSSNASTTRPEAILVEGGWTKVDGFWEKEIDTVPMRLEVVLTTSNTPLFDSVATYVGQQWQELGVSVTVNQFEQADLVQGIIRPRDFQALLFGADIGRSIDVYPFWHSSQKDDPGLNIAQYTNIDADAYLEDIRTATDTKEKVSAIQNFEALIADEMPAVFLFVPTFAYVLENDVTTAPMQRLGRPSERFANISQWHIKTHNLWPIFSSQ